MLKNRVVLYCISACALLLMIAPLMAAAHVAGMSLSVTPAAAALDVPMHVRVVGAVPGSEVDLSVTVPEGGRAMWHSDARFRANAAGVVDLSRQAPISGSYAGVHRMGLIWSMHQVPKSYPGLGLTFPAPIRYVVTASTTVSRTSKTILRLRMPHGVSCNNTQQTPPVAYVCHPNDGRAHPAIIVLGGSEGGEQRGIAALLAGHGYTTMALAYFAMPSLPQILREIPVETVGRAITWLQDQPFVQKGRIGIWGGSKGGELPLLSAATYPQLRAVASFYGSPMVWYGWRGDPPKPPSSSWTLDGKPLPYIRYAEGKPHLAGIDAPEFIAIEKIHGPILFVSGADDMEWPSARMAALGIERLHEKHHRYLDENLVYSNAGHGFSAPYYPTEILLPLGGTIAGNAFASRESWLAALRFFANNL